jgi:hypothetical protein
MGTPLKRFRIPPIRTEFARERCADVGVLACRVAAAPLAVGKTGSSKEPPNAARRGSARGLLPCGESCGGGETCWDALRARGAEPLSKAKMKKGRVGGSVAETIRQPRDRLKVQPQEREHSDAVFGGTRNRLHPATGAIACVRDGSPQGGDGFGSVYEGRRRRVLTFSSPVECARGRACRDATCPRRRKSCRCEGRARCRVGRGLRRSRCGLVRVRPERSAGSL